MARYADLDDIIAKLDNDLKTGDELITLSWFRTWLSIQPAADVAPRSEVDKLEYTLLGVMHSVDKWLDGDELEQDEVNRAITMREKTLRIVETAKAKAAEEIFAEIESCLDYIEEQLDDVPYSFSCVKEDITALKMKYTQERKTQ